MTLEKVHVTEHIHLSAIQTDKFKTGVLTLTLPFPADRRSVVFNSILPDVLRRGTERYPDMASLNRRLDELYASCVELRHTQIGNHLALILSAEVLDDAFVTDGCSVLDGVTEVMAQMLLHPRMTDGCFDADIVEQEKRFKRDALRSVVNNTRALASIRLSEMMFRENDSVPTLEERENGLEEVNGKTLADFWCGLLASAPLEVFYVGSLSASEVSQKLLPFFEAWQASPSAPIVLPTAEPSTSYLSKTEQMPVCQGKLAMGFRTGVTVGTENDLYYTALLLNEILGGSPASKLFLNVREKMSLCYSCSSSYNQYNGILSVSAGIESANRTVAEKAILAQLEDIRAGKISNAEFRAAKTSLENAYRQIYDNPFELQSFYGNRQLFGIDETVEGCRNKLNAVTKEAVVTLAKKMIHDTVFFIEGTKNGSQEDENE